MSEQSKGPKRHALLVALDIKPGRPVSAWPDSGASCDDEDDDWIVGLARRSGDGAYYAVTAEDIDCDDMPAMWVEIAKVRGRRRAEALAVHLNALNGGAA